MPVYRVNEGYLIEDEPPDAASDEGGGESTDAAVGEIGAGRALLVRPGKPSQVVPGLAVQIETLERYIADANRSDEDRAMYQGKLAALEAARKSAQPLPRGA